MPRIPYEHVKHASASQTSPTHQQRNWPPYHWLGHSLSAALTWYKKLHKSSPGSHIFLLVAVNKFTKWIEAAPVTSQDATSSVNFIKSIVFLFGVPRNIITDNGTNFTS